MKKKINAIVASLLVAVLMCPFALSGCTKENNTVNEDKAVIFDFNNEEGENARPYTVYADEDGKVNEPQKPEKNGYTFDYWAKDIDGKEKAQFPMTVNEVTRVYAQWKARLYDVSFNLNYETDSPVYDTKSVEYKKTVDAPEKHPERNGYVFRYWTSTPTSRNEVSFPYAVTRDTTFYASWRDADIKVFNVTLDYGDYEGAPKNLELEVEQGEYVLPSQVQATRKGYDLLGWSATVGGKDFVSFPYAPTGDITLYAVWILKTYTIKFAYNYYGAPSEFFKNQTFTVNDEIVDPGTPARDGYVFDGWYTSGKGGEKETFPVKRSGGGTYYAHWISELVTTDIFQAEYVEFDPTHKYIGYSGEPYGDQCIVTGEKGHEGLYIDNYPVNPARPGGNGYYVSYQYSRDSVLTFVVTAERDISGASFYVNWTTEYGGSFGVFGSDNYAVELNGTKLSFAAVTLTTSVEGVPGKFTESMLGTINLKKGENVIKLYPDNDLANGNLQSASPVIDYIRIGYSGSGLLSWRPVYDNLDNK